MSETVRTGQIEWSIERGSLCYTDWNHDYFLHHELTTEEVDRLRVIIEQYDQMHCDHEILGTGLCGRCDKQVTPFPGRGEAIKTTIEKGFS